MSTDRTQNCTRSQVEIAQNASSYILDRVDKHITIRKIADRMHVSQTQLKNSFRNYYGASMYKFIFGVSPSSYRRQHRKGISKA